MEDKNKYYFDDFQTSEYIKLIKIAKNIYKFRLFSNYNKNSDNFIIYRHDIDSSVHRAYKIAQIEYQEGIRTTYTINIHSMFYNFFEKEIISLLKKILLLNHEIGLHFDMDYYGSNIDDDNISNHLAFEKGIIEKMLKCKVNMFSFHNPTPESLKYNRNKYAGMVNAYSKYFREKVSYVSDSNGIWRFKRLSDILNLGEDKRLQVLTHPRWWTNNPMSPREKVIRCIDGRAKNILNTYDNIMIKHKRKNI